MRVRRLVVLGIILSAGCDRQLTTRDITALSAMRAAGQLARISGTPALQGPYELIDLGPGGAVDINDAGVIAGTRRAANGTLHAYSWTDGTVVELGTLGGPSSVARNINDAGQISGTSQLPTGEWHAFLWTSGSMRDLGPSLPGTIPRSLGLLGDRLHRLLNESGQVTWTCLRR